MTKNKTLSRKNLGEAIEKMLKKQASDITKAIEEIDLSIKPESIGIIEKVADGIVWARGLKNAQASEVVQLGDEKIYGLILNLQKDKVGIVVLGDFEKLKASDKVYRTGRLLSIGVSDEMLGRVINILGQPLDEKGEIYIDKYMPLEKKAPGIIERKSVSVPLQTGIKAIDSMIPIGRGQRELIIGDRSTGKTSIALTTIMNQKDQDVICVYVSIGQKRASVAQFINLLKQTDSLKYTIVVAATASDPSSELYLAPYAGTAIAEYFLEKGRDVLIIYDDLTKHAKAYREISLLLKRPSGREAYPGDVFYLHSRLLERACRLSEEYGGGSITALPIIETQANDVSAYIPTNVISITDGQIYLETDLFNKGILPPINIGLSVSRVGGSAQIKAMKQVAGTLKLDLAQLRELEAFSQFSSELDERTKKQLDRGLRVRTILNQSWDRPLKVEEQIIVIFAATNGYIDHIEIEEIPNWENKFIEFFHSNYQYILDEIIEKKKISDELFAQMHDACSEFNKSYYPQQDKQ